VCIRGLFYFAVDILGRGITARRLNGRDVASAVMALASAAGVAERERALERFPAAEAELQALVQGVPADLVSKRVEQLLASSAEDLPTHGPRVMTLHRDLAVELEMLRRAHEAQGRHVISERLAFAEQYESELQPLQEELEWRKSTMENLQKELELVQQSRSVRWTEPLRRIAAFIRRR
jgi:hypothetical protein